MYTSRRILNNDYYTLLVCVSSIISISIAANVGINSDAKFLSKFNHICSNITDLFKDCTLLPSRLTLIKLLLESKKYQQDKPQNIAVLLSILKARYCKNHFGIKD